MEGGRRKRGGSDPEKERKGEKNSELKVQRGETERLRELT